MAINLSAIITYSGKKVIILDLDMRKPKIHKAFDSSENSITNTKGMSNILAGTHNWEECVKESRLKNLFFITAGNIPPNPSELILSEKMKIIIEDLKKSFDYIVIDNPPIGLLADAMYRLQNADYPIYILRSMYSYRPFILTMENLKKNCNVKNLSFVLNDVSHSSHETMVGMVMVIMENTAMENTAMVGMEYTVHMAIPTVIIHLKRKNHFIDCKN